MEVAAEAVYQTPEGSVRKGLQEKITEFERLHAERVKRREELESALEPERFSDKDIDAAMQFRADIIEGMEAPTYEDKRRILELLRLRVNVTEDKAAVECVIPAEPHVIDLAISRNG